MLYKRIKFVFLLLVPFSLFSQDLHFSDVQGMAQWYNASLKQDRLSNVLLNMRDIRYQSTQAFQTGTVLLNLSTQNKSIPFSNEPQSFGNITLGAAFDKSNNALYRNNVGLLGYSYALNLDGYGTYLSAGFQGMFTNYKLGGNGTYQDQFDQYGPIPNGVSNDPLRFGKRFSYFSLNAGVSLFKRGDRLNWYAGLSARHVNRPFTEETKSAKWKLPETYGLQAGVSVMNGFSTLDLFGVLNRKAKAHETIVGLRYNFLMGDNSQEYTEKTNQSIVLGVGALYRVKDAIIPEIQLSVGKTTIGLHYDMNMNGIRAASFTRRGFELQLSQTF